MYVYYLLRKSLLSRPLALIKITSSVPRGIFFGFCKENSTITNNVTLFPSSPSSDKLCLKAVDLYIQVDRVLISFWRSILKDLFFSLFLNLVI